jgi:hypothetical protein
VCADDDNRIAWMASASGHGHGLTIGGCADLWDFCAHLKYGSTLQAICPASCGLCGPCADDDGRMAAMAKDHGLTISGCADVTAFCGHRKYGSAIQATCPTTCRSCVAPVRRLGDGSPDHVLV